MSDMAETVIDDGLKLLKPVARVPLIVVLCCAGLALLLGGAGWTLSTDHSTQVNRIDLLEHRADALEASSKQTVNDQAETLKALGDVKSDVKVIRQILEDRRKE